ncbi:PREDICTED: glutamate receptor [Prunus dulcis]|nr:PREDICTED: glutamate receptor [Prunus dulcis]
MGCPSEKNLESEPNQLHLISFWGLYLLCGVFTISALLIFLLRVVLQFVRYKKRQAVIPSTLSSSSSWSSRFSESIYNFVDFIDEKEEAIKRMFIHGGNPQGQAT